MEGMWWALIGVSLHGAARASYQQLLNRRALECEPVRRFMEGDPVTVSPSGSIGTLVEDHINKHHYKTFPVVRVGELIGCITTKQFKEIPREEWDRRKVWELDIDCTPEKTSGPEEDALKALSLMNQTCASRLMVVDGGRPVGIITLKDMLQFLSLKLELEE